MNSNARLPSFSLLLLFSPVGCDSAPPGRARASQPEVGGDCDTGDLLDVMVPVGAWCVDKYQAVVCDRSRTGSAFDGGCISNTNHNNGRSGNDSTHETVGEEGVPSIDLGDQLKTVIGIDGALLNPNFRAYSTIGISQEGLIPTRFANYYQAVTACTNANKALIPDAVFVAAALGTHDPGPERLNLDGPCNTAPDEGHIPGTLRPTGHAGHTRGGADSCISNWDVEDMIGMRQWTDFATRMEVHAEGGQAILSHTQGRPWFSNRGRGSVRVNSVSASDAVIRAHIFGFRCARPRIRYDSM
jgi:hypothetical protein